MAHPTKTESITTRYKLDMDFNYYKPCRKGGHTHNQLANARHRSDICPHCDGIIPKGFGVRRYDGVLFCTDCAQADYDERYDHAKYMLNMY